ncbi:MAG: DUF2157 domain-containing protein [Alphaproteobacteria bacterium]|nr:DUF2157 domain-containing protein [Alphaproteobacteria bacterium]
MKTTPEDLLRLRNEGLLSEEEYYDALDKLDEEANGKVRSPRSYEPSGSVKRVPMDPERIRKRIIFSVALLGIFSVLAGIGLIIAANWKFFLGLPAIVKVSFGLGLLVISLITAFFFHQNKKKLWEEAFLFISFLLIGGNIALIQQSYHLSISLQKGSLIWWLLSLPLLFFTRYKLLPLCSIALLGFAVWDIIWEMNYMLLAGMMFLIMMLTHFFTGSKAKFIRQLAFILGMFCLYVGDIGLSNGRGVLGIITTTFFLIMMLSSPKTEDGAVRYYNYLFLLVAWRVFLLFCRAYYDLMNIGVALVVFGLILLAGAGFYTYYYKQIQDAIRGFIKHE